MKTKLILGVISCLCISSCSGPGDLSVRAVSAENAQPATADQPILLIAQGHFRQGNYALAAHEYRRALRHSPDLVDAYNGLAASYDQMGRFDLAQRYYQEALARAPENPTVRHNLALSLRLQDRRDELRVLARENAAIGLGILPIAPDELTFSVPPAASADEGDAEDRSATRLYRLSIGEVALITSADSPLAIDQPPRTRSAEAVPPDRVIAGSEGTEWRWRIAGADRSESPASELQAWARIFRSVSGVLARNRTDHAARSAGQLPPADVRMTAGGPEWSWRIQDRTGKEDALATRLAVLNAVGRRGQAARMRRHLRTSGWREIAIGDAANRPPRSSIRYIEGKRREALRLADQLPFAVDLVRTRGDRLVLVLGRNAVSFDRQLQGALVS